MKSEQNKNKDWRVYALYFDDNTLNFYASDQDIRNGTKGLEYAELVKDHGNFEVVTDLPCLNAYDALRKLEICKKVNAF